MSPAGTTHKLAWACGGEIIIAHWKPNGKPGAVSIADASDLHSQSLAGMKRAASDGATALHDYHQRWERALREAIAARSLQRRASGGIQQEENVG